MRLCGMQAASSGLGVDGGLLLVLVLGACVGGAGLLWGQVLC